MYWNSDLLCTKHILYWKGDLVTDDGLTLSWQRPLSYRNQPIDFLRKSVDWFLYDNGLRHERVKIGS